MEVGVDSPGAGRVSGVAMEFPATDDASFSPPRMPRRLRRRLLSEGKAVPSTVEEIEAKLRDADHRRQKFYESLSSKARPKPRSPSQSSSHEEDLGQRLEAKLQAAEQKRLSILEKAQRRLAKLDELRQAAKTGVEMRFRKECAELGTRVESRVQQAEANRMLILKAYKQRRATLKERTSESLLRVMARENKYKERVHAAILQKRAAAEKKRLGLLEEEKKRARARMLQVRKVAKSVSYQREIERRKMKDKLEDRLQRAKRQRAEYLSHRGRLQNTANWNKMQKQAEILSAKLARCWRRFVKLNKTTLNLAKAYDALNISERAVKSMPFEQLALLIESPATLETVKALLDRLEIRYKLSKPVSASNNPSTWNDIDHLLKRVASPSRRRTPRKSTPSKGVKRSGSMRELARSPVKLSRYQVRIVLCAYMILGQPDAVFSGQGEREFTLAKAAEKFVREFELLIRIILGGPIEVTEEESDAYPRRLSLRSQLASFDAAWCSYLNSFVVWKVKDAESLEEDLVRAACQMELSMMQTCKMTQDGDNGALTHDMKAVQKQVTDDQKLLREKVHHLSGTAGIERMEFALSDTRMKYFQAVENGDSVGSPMHITSPIPPSFVASPSVSNADKRGKAVEGNQRPSSVVRTLFKDDSSSPSKEVSPSASSSRLDSQLHHSAEKFSMENELIVNEVLHEQHHTFADNLNVTSEDQSQMKAKIKETMEKAFWDGITNSMEQDEPKYDRVVELMREVRDEICEMVPQSWKADILEAIDLDILSQVLNSGQLDMDFLGKILEFALVTLQKLSAPASEDELKIAHQKKLKELAEICHGGNGSNHLHVVALIKGLRFVLEQIQALKQEISKARIKLMEPLLKGPAGLEYLNNAFANRYGPPSDASTALPLTKMWLSSVWASKDQEWLEHTNALSVLMMSNESLSQRLLPSTTLRTGVGKISGSQMIAVPSASKNATHGTGPDNRHPDCKGEKVDLVVRLSLLKLVSGVCGLTQEALPETLKLNFTRLRGIQAQLQKIIVISTSVLVLRQTLLTEQMVRNATDMETILSNCIKQLSKLLDSSEDVGINEIIETLCKFVESDNSADGDDVKIQPRKNIMARFLTKSLQDGDPVFSKVSRAVYSATRGVVLGGSGPGGRALAETALRQVGAAALLDDVVESATVVLVAAAVSCRVHGPWYDDLVEKM
ncbi:hypothetical protein RHMOL_Rhmol11G0189500 [Rhododendron molle]|uniref:Uncharacterized protein n=1 Tax=Rhododendron molle TaxID=49168 RepID=A0ACC0LTZ4_RHOML|nr:hypothetical protein RHMOL_Rhmol11G0189500 [Rhododendron molle]